jgi:hypothetical protein
MAVNFVWSDIIEGTVTDPDPINRLGHQVEDLSNRASQYAGSFSASSAIGTGVTGILTITSALLRSGRAYSVENIGAAFGDVDGRRADFGLWTPNTSGTLIGAFYRTYCGGPGVQSNAFGKFYLKRTAATDFTGDLVLAMNSNAGTVTHDAAANRPRALVVSDVGPAANYPLAFDVT